MNSRQAITIAACFPLLIGLAACSSVSDRVSAQTLTPSVTATFAPSPVPAANTPSPAPTVPGSDALFCPEESGRVEKNLIETTNPPQEFLIYLPPCYDVTADINYPVLYLLHGQTYTDDQWVRLDAPTAANRLIHEREAAPFIIVFPDDRYWNLQAGSGFGDRLVNHLIPYVDSNYRTLADRGHRSLGGLSRGGGWTIDLGFANPELFGALGLHSPAIFVKDGPYVEKMIRALPEEDRPLLWLDIGDVDPELSNVMPFEEKLSSHGYIHEFHLYPGAHTEEYWGAHVEEYLRWYSQRWMEKTE
jgi:enterochelin esterase-like enzyme